MTNQTLLAANADSLARLHTAEAVGTVVDIMRGNVDGRADMLNTRLRAAQAIIDRGHGRAVQAVISVPARQAVAARLAAMSDDELLRIAKGASDSLSAEGGGSREQNGGPVPPLASGGTIPLASRQVPMAEGGAASRQVPVDEDDKPRAKSRDIPRHLAGCDISDAELDYDPCS